MWFDGLSMAFLNAYNRLLPVRERYESLVSGFTAGGHVKPFGMAGSVTPSAWADGCAPTGSCPQYHQARRRGQVDRWCYWQLEPGQWVNKWREPCADEALLTELQALPADAFKVEATDQMLSICWGERGAGAALEKVVGFLKARA